MDRVLYYRKCDEVLSHLLREGPADIDAIKKISPEYYRAIIQEFEEKQLCRYDSISYYSATDNARRYYDGRYYEIKAEEKQREIDRDSLSERSVKCAEASAEAARSSADSARKANLIAEESNKKAHNSNVIAIVSIVISLLCGLFGVFSKCCGC